MKTSSKTRKRTADPREEPSCKDDMKGWLADELAFAWAMTAWAGYAVGGTDNGLLT